MSNGVLSHNKSGSLIHSIKLTISEVNQSVITVVNTEGNLRSLCKSGLLIYEELYPSIVSIKIIEAYIKAVISNLISSITVIADLSNACTCSYRATCRNVFLVAKNISAVPIRMPTAVYRQLKVLTCVGIVSKFTVEPIRSLRSTCKVLKVAIFNIQIIVDCKSEYYTGSSCSSFRIVLNLKHILIVSICSDIKHLCRIILTRNRLTFVCRLELSISCGNVIKVFKVIVCFTCSKTPLTFHNATINQFLPVNVVCSYRSSGFTSRRSRDHRENRCKHHSNDKKD